jgi:hypothetical protein
VRKKEINKGGAPSKYKKIYATEAKKLCLLGCNDKELASFFEISVSTLNKWKLDYKEFSESLKGGKIIADGSIADKLFKRAMGFYYDEVTFEKTSLFETVETENIKKDAYKKKVIRKYVIPDVGAQTLWLKNRQKNKWRDKQIFEFEKLTDEQLDEIIERLKK